MTAKLAIFAPAVLENRLKVRSGQVNTGLRSGQVGSGQASTIKVVGGT